MKVPLQYATNAPFELSPDQKETFRAIMDTVIARLTFEEESDIVPKIYPQVSKENLHAFCQIQGTDIDNGSLIFTRLGETIPMERRSQIMRILRLLSTRPGTFLLTGHFSAFKDLSRSEREAALLRWRHSSVPKIRALFKALTMICSYAFYRSALPVVSNAMQYFREEHGPANDLPPRLPMMSVEDIIKQPEPLHFDCIVVGSGAGGGVVAAQLAQAGKSVLVIDKGAYYEASEFTAEESEAYDCLYEKGGAFTSQSGSLSIYAGSNFGGGTTVNWAACLKLQHFVREEWARLGLSHFVSPKFAQDLDRVFDRIGAKQSGVVHNSPNQVVVDGCRALGFPVSTIDQNTDGRPHECGRCFIGCRSGIKNGTVNTWLQDANAHGAKFLDRTRVERVLISKGKAVGVEAVVHHEHRVTIHANEVVVAAGSLQTPGVLLRSGLTNPHIGRHLKVHPCTIVMGFFDKPMDAHKGSIMTAVSQVAENVDSQGYGAKLEVPTLHPANYSTIIPWRGAVAHKEYLLRFRHSSSVLVLSRDKDSVGRVWYDKEGRLKVDYELSTHDRQSILAGIKRGLQILCAAGARELHTSQYGLNAFVFRDDEPSHVDNPRFVAWLDSVAAHGIPNDGASISCAHQMGTCRMGVSPAVAAVKPTGETWQVQHLHVADASLFPGASGVNPMVTTEAIALHVADSILQKADRLPAKL